MPTPTNPLRLESNDLTPLLTHIDELIQKSKPQKGKPSQDCRQGENLQKHHQNLGTPLWIACWDFDGTLIDGDITEGKEAGNGSKAYLGLLELVIRQGFVPSYARANGVDAFWQDYKRLLAEDEEKAYLFAAELLSEIAPSLRQAMRKFIHELLSSYYQPHLLSDSLSLFSHLRQLGVHNCIVSASPQHFLSELIHILDINTEQIFGINRDFVEGELVDPIVNYRLGKVERTKAILARQLQSQGDARLLLGVGNCWRSDGPMVEFICEQGGLGLMINAGQAPAWAKAFPIYTLNTLATLGRKV